MSFFTSNHSFQFFDSLYFILSYYALLAPEHAYNIPMAGYIPLPVIQKEAWAQCENPNCEKWRKLPPGAPPINEDEPWYCYMNPDLARNTCSASEVVRYKRKNGNSSPPYIQLWREIIGEVLQQESIPNLHISSSIFRRNMMTRRNLLLMEQRILKKQLEIGQSWQN